MPTLLARARFWPALAAVILIASMLLPPAAGYARQYAFAQALQFVIFAVAGPALLVLAIRWRMRPFGCPAPDGTAARCPRGDPAGCLYRLGDHLAAAGRGQRAGPHPALTAVEMITLLAIGTGVWAELAGPRPAPGQLARPARATMAAAAMWTIWILAYLTGMSGTSWFAAYRHRTPGRLGPPRISRLPWRSCGPSRRCVSSLSCTSRSSPGWAAAPARPETSTRPHRSARLAAGLARREAGARRTPDDDP